MVHLSQQAFPPLPCSDCLQQRERRGGHHVPPPQAGPAGGAGGAEPVPRCGWAGGGGFHISVAKLVDGQYRECVPAMCSLNICVTPSPGGGGLQNIGGVGWAREKVPPGGGVIPPHMVPAQTGTRQQKGLCSLLVPSPSSHLPATAWLLNMSNFVPPPALNSFRMTYMQWAEVRGINTCMNAWEGFQNANGVRTPQTHKHTDQTGTD